MTEEVLIGGKPHIVEKAEGTGPLEFMDVSKGLSGCLYYVRGSNTPIQKGWYVVKTPEGLLSIMSPEFLEQHVDE